MDAPAKLNRYPVPYHWYLPPFWEARYFRALELAQPWWPEGGPALDLGCGDGRMAEEVASRLSPVVGVDSQLQPLRFARLLTDRLRLAVADGRRAPLRDGLFRLVVCFEVIEHVPREDARRLLAEARRLLAPGGVLLLSTPNREELRGRIWGHRVDEKHYHEYTAEELSSEVSSAGLSVLAVKGIYLPPPIPAVEHYCNVFPFRWLFKAFVRWGENRPTLAETLFVAARRE